MGKKLLKIHDVDFAGEEVAYKWYIVCTLYNNERKAADQIEKRFHSMGAADQLAEIFVPIIEWEEETQGRRKKDGTYAIRKVKKSKNLLEGGYIFIKMVMNNHTWNIVRQTTGVAGWLNSVGSGQPKEERESEVVRFKKLMIQENPAAAATIEIPKVEFTGVIGDMVKITAGAMKDYQGKVTEIIKDKLKIEEANTGMQIEVKVDEVQVV